MVASKGDFMVHISEDKTRKMLQCRKIKDSREGSQFVVMYKDPFYLL